MEAKPQKKKFLILSLLLIILALVGAVFGAYKFGQRRIQPTPQPTPIGEKVFCKEPRPEICTMELIIPPPYICGSDGRAYGNKCNACANPRVGWYVVQEAPCGEE